MKQQLDFETLAQSEGLLQADGLEHGQRFGAILGNIMQATMVIGLLILLFYFIWGAFDWITSAGDKSKTESARNKMMHSTIGMIILASTIVMFMIVQGFLGIKVLDFSFTGASTTTETVVPGSQCLVGSHCPLGSIDGARSDCGSSCTNGICCVPL